MRTRLPIFYGCVWYGESTAVVRLQYVSGCGKSIKVRRKYAKSKAYVRLNYGIMVKVQYCTETFFGAYYITIVVPFIIISSIAKI